MYCDSVKILWIWGLSSPNPEIEQLQMIVLCVSSCPGSLDTRRFYAPLVTSRLPSEEEESDSKSCKKVCITGCIFRDKSDPDPAPSGSLFCFGKLPHGSIGLHSPI